MNFSDHHYNQSYSESVLFRQEADFWAEAMQGNRHRKSDDWKFKGRISYEDYTFVETEDVDSPANFQKRRSSEDEIQVICTFCSESFGIGNFESHENICEKKKILCEECGQKILINAFSLHIEICKPQFPKFDQNFTAKPEIYDNLIPTTDYRNHSLNANDIHQLHNVYEPIIDYNDFEIPNDNDSNPRASPENNNDAYLDNEQYHYQQDVIDDPPHFQVVDSDDSDIYIHPPYEQMEHRDEVQEEYKVDPEIYFNAEPFEDNQDVFYEQPPVIPQEADQPETYEQLLALDETIVKIGLNKNQLDNFPTRTFLACTNSNTCCSVCLEDFELGETLKKIKCKHEFHKSCIETWLKSNITCPVCKMEMR